MSQTLTYSALVDVHENWNQEIISTLADGSWLQTALNLQEAHHAKDTSLYQIVPESNVRDWQSTVYNKLDSVLIEAWKADGNMNAAKKLIAWFCGRKGATVALLRASVPNLFLKSRLDEMVSSFLSRESDKQKVSISCSSLPKVQSSSGHSVQSTHNPFNTVLGNISSLDHPHNQLSSQSPTDQNDMLYSKLIALNKEYEKTIILYLSDGSWYETACNLQAYWRHTPFALYHNQIMAWKSLHDHSEAAKRLLQWFSSRPDATVSKLRDAVPKYNLKVCLDEMISSVNYQTAPDCSNSQVSSNPKDCSNSQMSFSVSNQSENNQSPLCCVCMEKFPKRIILGCFHAICKECHENPDIKSCPVCRGALHPARDVFFS